MFPRPTGVFLCVITWIQHCSWSCNSYAALRKSNSHLPAHVCMLRPHGKFLRSAWRKIRVRSAHFLSCLSISTKALFPLYIRNLHVIRKLFPPWNSLAFVWYRIWEPGHLTGRTLDSSPWQPQHQIILCMIRWLKLENEQGPVSNKIISMKLMYKDNTLEYVPDEWCRVCATVRVGPDWKSSIYGEKTLCPSCHALVEKHKWDLFFGVIFAACLSYTLLDDGWSM